MDYADEWNGPIGGDPTGARKPKSDHDVPEGVGRHPLQDFYQIARESKRDDAQRRRFPDSDAR